MKLTLPENYITIEQAVDHTVWDKHKYMNLLVHGIEKLKQNILPYCSTIIFYGNCLNL